MKKLKFLLITSALALMFSTAGIAGEGKPRVMLQTNQGDILLELDPEAAPLSVKNFLAYAKDGAYDGTIFHRVIKDFMIQGGGFSEDYQRRPTGEQIRNEADNGLKNKRGTIAMARTSAPHSATNQFFINLVDNGFLDHTAPDTRGWGYTVFGKVVEGMETVDKIGAMRTGRGGPFRQDVPKTPVIINQARIVE